MHSAQSDAKHTAQLAVMQAAYDSAMDDQSTESKGERPFRKARRDRLALLIEEAGNATQLALVSGTPKTHISAMLAGDKGIGDTICTKFESQFDKPLGWMDTPVKVDGDGIDWHTLAVQVAMGHAKADVRSLLLDFVEMVRAERTRAMQAIAERAKKHTPTGAKG